MSRLMITLTASLAVAALCVLSYRFGRSEPGRVYAPLMFQLSFESDTAIARVLDDAGIHHARLGRGGIPLVDRADFRRALDVVVSAAARIDPTGASADARVLWETSALITLGDTIAQAIGAPAAYVFCLQSLTAPTEPASQLCAIYIQPDADSDLTLAYRAQAVYTLWTHAPNLAPDSIWVFPLTYVTLH